MKKIYDSTEDENIVPKVASETNRILKDNLNPFLGKSKKDAFQIGIEIALFDAYMKNPTEWYANKINKNISEFDEFDHYVCKVLKKFQNE